MFLKSLINFKRFLNIASVLCAVLLTAALLCACGGDESLEVSESAVSNPTPTATPVPVKTVTISCAGDCTLASDENFYGNTFETVFAEQNGDFAYFFENVRDIFEDDDLTIVNLECALSERGQRADKTFAFRGSPDYVNILKEGSVEAVTLANNHSMDYGEAAFDDTKQILDENGIEYAINDIVAHLDIDGVSVAVVGLYQLDYSADTVIESAMQEASGDDLIIVQVHWGIERDAEPTSEQVSLAHKAIDLGADLVIGHHPHVLQGVEKYNGKFICYSLGNFCFGGNTNLSDKDTMIFKQTFTLRDGSVENSDDYEIIPCSVSSVGYENDYRPTPLTGDEKTRVEEKITERSRLVGDGNLDLKFDE